MLEKARKSGKLQSANWMAKNANDKCQSAECTKKKGGSSSNSIQTEWNEVKYYFFCV